MMNIYKSSDKFKTKKRERKQRFGENKKRKNIQKSFKKVLTKNRGGAIMYKLAREHRTLKTIQNKKRKERQSINLSLAVRKNGLTD